MKLGLEQPVKFGIVQVERGFDSGSANKVVGRILAKGVAKSKHAVGVHRSNAKAARQWGCTPKLRPSQGVVQEWVEYRHSLSRKREAKQCHAANEIGQFSHAQKYGLHPDSLD